MTHELQRLQTRHYKMLEMVLAGHTCVDIATALDVNKENVRAITRSPLFMGELNRRLAAQTESGIAEDRAAFEGKARSILEKAAPKAAETIVDLLDSDDDSVRGRMGESILNRVIGKPDTKLGGDSVSPSVVISAETAQLLVVTLKEINPNAEIPIANGQTAEVPENQREDVYQAPPVGSGVGHREAEAQSRPQEVRSDDEE